MIRHNWTFVPKTLSCTRLRRICCRAPHGRVCLGFGPPKRLISMQRPLRSRAETFIPVDHGRLERLNEVGEMKRKWNIDCEELDGNRFQVCGCLFSGIAWSHPEPLTGLLLNSSSRQTYTALYMAFIGRQIRV